MVNIWRRPTKHGMGPPLRSEFVAVTTPERAGKIAVLRQEGLRHTVSH
jgi:hypothetical protein